MIRAAKYPFNPLQRQVLSVTGEDYGLSNPRGSKDATILHLGPQNHIIGDGLLQPTLNLNPKP